MSNLRAVIFDLDDTLFPEEAYVLSGFRAVAAYADEQLGIRVESGFQELSQLYHDDVRGKTFDRWLANREIKPADWVPKLVTIYREHRPKIECFDGVPQLLRELSSKYQLGLITDGWFAVQEAKIEALEIADYFETIVISDQWGRDYWKPHERPFHAALSELGVSPDSAVYVADNPQKDFFAARRIGMHSIRARYAKRGVYGLEEPQSEDYAPDMEIATLAELLPKLEALKGKN